MTIDPRWLDVDFPREANLVGRRMGLVPKPQGMPAGVDSPIFEERFSSLMIPRGEWRGLIEIQADFTYHKTYQYDQDGEGTCTANAAGGCYAYLWSRTFGKATHAWPSPISVYRFCARGPQTGSTTACILKRARDVGFLLIDSPECKKTLENLNLPTEHVLKAVGYSQRFPDGWEDTARHFRIDEFYECDSVAGMFSAVLNGFSLLYGRAGHAIHGVQAMWNDGGPVLKYDNSWGNWGDNGFGYDSERYLERNRAAWGAYAIRSIVAPGGLMLA